MLMKVFQKRRTDNVPREGEITTAMSKVNERDGNASTRGTGIRKKQRQFIYSNLREARSVSQITSYT